MQAIGILFFSNLNYSFSPSRLRQWSIFDHPTTDNRNKGWSKCRARLNLWRTSIQLVLNFGHKVGLKVIRCHCCWRCSRLIFSSRVIFDQLLQLFQIVNHVDTFAPIEARWFQNPNILPVEVTQRHYEATWASRETLNVIVVVVLNVHTETLISRIQSLFRQQNTARFRCNFFKFTGFLQICCLIWMLLTLDRNLNLACIKRLYVLYYRIGVSYKIICFRCFFLLRFLLLRFCCVCEIAFKFLEKFEYFFERFQLLFNALCLAIRLHSNAKGQG